MRVATDRAKLCPHTNNGIWDESRFPRFLHSRPLFVLVETDTCVRSRDIYICRDWFGRPIPRYRLTLSYRKPMQERRLESGRYAWFMDTRYCSRSCRHNARRCFRSALSTSAQWMSTQIGELNYTVCPHPQVQEICGLKKLIGTQDGGYERMWVTSGEVQIAKLINNFN